MSASLKLDTSVVTRRMTGFLPFPNLKPKSGCKPGWECSVLPLDEKVPRRRTNREECMQQNFPAFGSRKIRNLGCLFVHRCWRASYNAFSGGDMVS